jgi:hypothetical protein
LLRKKRRSFMFNNALRLNGKMANGIPFLKMQK